jgi:hypothetical protein
MNPLEGDSDSEFLSPDELAVETELRAYAARMAPTPSAGFADRTIAAAERGSAVASGRGLSFAAAALARAAAGNVRVALGQLAGGPAIPARVRLQAGAMLVAIALLVTGGAALAAAGATSVVTWVAGPPATASPSRSTVAPTIKPHETAGAPARSDHPTGSANPGNCGKPSQNPGNGNQPSENPGNCGGSSQKPGNGNQPSDHPGRSNHPGPSNHPGASDHPGPSNHPGNGGRPTQAPTSKS